jgi:hypothetical protein
MTQRIKACDTYCVLFNHIGELGFYQVHIFSKRKTFSWLILKVLVLLDILKRSAD